MNVILSQGELLLTFRRRQVCQQLQHSLTMSWPETNEYIDQCRQTMKYTGLITIDFNRVNYLLSQDLQTFRNIVNSEFKSLVQQQPPVDMNQIKSAGMTKQQVIDQYLADPKITFAKILAPMLASDLRWIVDHNDIDWTDSFFIRNILGNELIIARCLEEHRDFWFVDTGYTNFLEHKNKKWHRLLFKHIHHGFQPRQFPTDRLSLFPKLPRPWRRKGSKILVIESSENHYQLQGTTLERWKQAMEQGIRAVSDRPIEFRPKPMDRKNRTTVYDLLKDNKEYYCVVSDSSAAAVEAVWAGVPIITLNRHITNSVSSRSVVDIDNLYREDIESWLAMLSYSQWTQDEIASGQALAMTQEWHRV